jgi:integrase
MGRLCDRSIANTLTPLRLALDVAVAAGLLDATPRTGCTAAPPRRSRLVFARAEPPHPWRARPLLDQVPAKWRPLFELLAATGLRISEAIGLRWSHLVLDGPTPHLHVERRSSRAPL